MENLQHSLLNGLFLDIDEEEVCIINDMSNPNIDDLIDEMVKGSLLPKETKETLLPLIPRSGLQKIRSIYDQALDHFKHHQEVWVRKSASGHHHAIVCDPCVECQKFSHKLFRGQIFFNNKGDQWAEKHWVNLRTKEIIILPAQKIIHIKYPVSPQFFGTAPQEQEVKITIAWYQSMVAFNCAEDFAKLLWRPDAKYTFQEIITKQFFTILVGEPESKGSKDEYFKDFVSVETFLQDLVAYTKDWRLGG